MDSSIPTLSLRRIILGLILMCGAVGRLLYLGADIRLLDEAYPVALIERHDTTGSWDLNLGTVGLENYGKDDTYAGSAYHMACIVWNGLVRHLPETLGGGTDGPEVVKIRVRVFSALTSIAALGLWAWICSRRLEILGASVAVALMAFAPLYLQDAHYARPDAFLLLIVLGYVALWTEGAPTNRRAALAGLILGIGIAAKITLGPLGIIPLGLGAGRLFRKWLLHAVMALVGFAATAPWAFTQPAKYLAGIHTLAFQYTHLFPGLGPLKGGSTYGMAGAYAWAVFGPACVILLAWGFVTARRSPREIWVAYVIPFVAFTALFGVMTNFFERSYGPFLPGAFLLIGIGLDALPVRTLAQRVLAVVAALLALAPSTWIGARFVGVVLSGEAALSREAFHRQMAASLAPTPVHYLFEFSNTYWAITASEAATATHPYALAIIDFNDPWTRRGIEVLKRDYGLAELAVHPGPFDGLPPCTLLFYHEGTIRYFLVKPALARPSAAAGR